MEETEYASVGIENQRMRGSRRCSENRVYYKTLNAVQFDRETEYEHLQVGTAATGKKEKSHTGSNGNVKNRRRHFAIFMLLTVFGIIAIIALAIGALGLKGSLTAQNAIEEELRNHTYLMEEISALKVFLDQLSHETQVNMSQLSDGLSSSVDSISNLASSASSKAYCNSISISSLSSTVSKLSYSYCICH